MKTIFLSLLCAYWAGVAYGDSSLQQQLTPFLKRHCLECHSGREPDGGLDLEAASFEMGDAEVRRRWTYLHDRVASGEMPPAAERPPKSNAKSAFLTAIGEALTRAESAHRKHTLRRLNRREYEHTVCDMFGVHVDVKRLLPDDEAEQGFDTTASTLSLSSEQMVLYLEAADLALDQLFGPAQKPRTIHTTVNFATTRRGAGESERKLDDGVVLFSGAKILPLYDASLPEPGQYRVRVKVRAEQSERPVVLHVLGGMTGAIAPHTTGFFEALPGKTTTIEFMERAIERSDNLGFGLIGGYPWWRVEADTYQGAGLFLGDIEIQGPLEEWPPPSRAKLFGDVDPLKGALEDAREILSRQARLAFRRPVDDAEVEPYVALAKQALSEGASFEKALRRGLKGILCAPEFLFLQSPSAKLDDFAVASRLSYWLWSSLPDRELLSLAERGELTKPKTLIAQVERMLADPRSQRFVESFTGQWLRLRDIDFTVPDHNLYPEYNQLLRESMLKETHAFFRELLDRDLSVNNFIDSDFAMLNRPLAEFYGLEGVEGLQIRRVKLPDNSLRGGVLTHASVLKVSADGTRTSPVLRGSWILKHLYGTPSPPPPPTIEAIEPDIRGASTIRERLAKHREHESCNRCHRKIDPPGFALERFDVIGAQRDWYRTRGEGKYVKKPRHPQAPNHHVLYRQGPDVDASGTMPDGRAFSGVQQYKQLLLEDETMMPQALARMLLSYSVGRELEFADRAEVEHIWNATGPEYGLRSLIHRVVQSQTFLRR